MPTAPLSWELSSARAADYYWDVNGTTSGAGTPTDGVWDATTTNWTTDPLGETALIPWANENTAVFAAGIDAVSPYTVAVVGTQTIGGLRFEEGTTTLTGGSLNLFGAPIIQLNAGASAEIGSSIVGAGPLTLSLASGNSLTLSGNNTYSGGTTINGGGGTGGIVRAVTGNAFGSGSVTLQDTGTILELGLSNVASSLAFSNNLIIDNAGDLKILRNAGSVVSSTWGGTITVNESTAGNFRLNANGGTLRVTGQITSTAGAGLRTEGTGTVILASANSLGGTALFSGGGTVLLGTSNSLSGVTGITLQDTGTKLDLANGVALTGPTITISATGVDKHIRLALGATSASIGNNFTVSETSSNDGFRVNAQGGTLTLSGNITSTAGAGLRQDGTGTVILSGTNNITGTVSLAGGGTLRIATSAAQGTAGYSMAATNAVLEIGDGINFGRTISISNTGNAKTLRLLSGATSGTFSNTITIAETSGGNFRVDPNGGTLTISGQITGTGGAGIQQLTAGTTILTGATNNYTGTATINHPAAILRTSGTGLIGTGNMTLRAGLFDVAGTVNQTITVLTIGGSAGNTAAVTIAAGRTLTITGGTNDYINYDTASVAALGATMSGGTLALGGTVKNFNIENQAAIDIDMEISSSITSTGGIGLVKTGTGLLKLSGTNSYTGATTLSAGTLEASSLDNLSTASTNVIFNGGNLRWAPGSTFDVSARTTTFNATFLAGFDTNGNNVVLASAIGATGAGGLNKTGLGTLGLSIASQLNYTGTTRVTQGTLDLNGTAQTVTSLTMGGGVAGSSSVLDLDGATLTLGGSVIYLGTNNPLAATITSATPAVIDFGGAARTFDIGDSTAADPDLIIDTNVTLQNDGGGGLIKIGTGTLRINGTNNLTGLISVQAGAVTGNIGAGNLILNGGVFEGNGTFTRGLGTGNNEVQWAAGAAGGFAAFGGSLTVTLGGAPDPLVWDSTPFFVSGAGSLLFGSATANDVVTFTHNIDLNSTGSSVTRAVSVVDNTTVTTDYAILSGNLSQSGAGAATFDKTGTGVLRLTGANTFAGGVTVTAGILEFSTVSDNGGPASNLGQGTNGITLAGGRLKFIGSANQSTNRQISLTGSTVLDASGDPGITITYGGTITSTGDNSLNLDGTGFGIINAAVLTSGSAADLNKSGTGTWRLDVAPTIVDNVVVNAGLLIFNAPNSFDGDDLFIRAATLRLGINGALTNAMDDLNISTETATGGVLDIFGTTGGGTTDVIIGANPNLSTSPMLSGSLVDSVSGGLFSSTTLNVRNGVVSGNVATTGATTLGNTVITNLGTVNSTAGTISGNLTLNAGSTLALINGLISGNITFGAGIGLTKQSMNTVTLSGTNAVAGAGATVVNAGTLVLDYSSNTGVKLGSGGLTMSGGVLQIDGHASTPTTLAVGNLTLGSAADPGASRIRLNPAGTDVTLQLGTITRNAGSVLRVNPATTAGHVSTSATNTAGTILGGWATYQVGTGTTQFATVSGGEILGFTSTEADAVGAWTTGLDATDNAGFTGATAARTTTSINSLRFNAASGNSLVTVSPLSILNITSGGILITDLVAAGAPTIAGGRLSATTADLIVTHDGAATFTVASRLVGVVGLTKAGTGTMVLNGTNNTSNGTVRVTAGTLRLQGGNAIGDAAPVIIDQTGNVLLDVVDSEVIGSLSGGDAANYRGGSIQIADSKSLTITQTATGTFYGNITAASGSATLNKFGGSTLSFIDNIINLGPAGVINIAGGRLTLDINGNNNQIQQVAAGATINISNGGSLFIEHNGITLSGAISGGRIADDVDLVFSSGGSTTDSLLFRHDQNDDYIEVVGTVTFASGVSSVRVDTTGTNSSALAVFRATSIARSNQATLVLRGANIHKTSNPRAQFQNASDTFVPFGTGTGTSQPIIPWAVGPSGGGTSAAPDTFLTATPSTANSAWRPLDLATEYHIVSDATTWSAAASTNNVLLNATVTGAAGGKTIRSLVVATGTGTVDLTGDGAGTLVVDSGGFLFSGTGSSTISGFTGIGTNAAPNEYIFHVPGAASVVTIDPQLSSAAGKITKSGAGTLVLTANNTTLGATSITTINEGVLQIADLDNIGGAGTGGLIFAGGTLRLNAGFADDLTTKPISFLSGGGTLDVGTNNLIFAASLGSGIGAFTKSGAGNLTLSVAATFSGGSVLNGGIITLGAQNALGTGPITLAGATLNNGNVSRTFGNDLILNAATGTLEGAGNFFFGANFSQIGSRTLLLNNTGTTTFGDSSSDRVTLAELNQARTLSLNVAGTAAVINATIDDGPGTGADGITKLGAGILYLNASNFYSGATTLDQGRLVITADQNLAGALVLGAGGATTTPVVADFESVDTTFGGLTMNVNSATPSTILMGSTKSLTLTGNVQIGATTPAVANTVTRLTIPAGTLNVTTTTSLTFAVGGATTLAADTLLDLTGLSGFTVNAGTGTFRVNNPGTTNVTGSKATILLPTPGVADTSPVTTITAANFNVGDAGTFNNQLSQINSVVLGTGLTTINATNINVGTGSRDVGSITFAGSAGRITIRGADGVSRNTALNIGTGGATTSASAADVNNLVDFAGHQADLLIGALNIGNQARTGNLMSELKFDTGTLDATGVTIGFRTGSTATAATLTNTLTLGGGTVTIGSGGIDMGSVSNTSTTANVTTATINISGGAMSVANNTSLGAAIRLGNNTAGSGLAAVEASLNITGGTVTLAGHIIKGTNTRTTSTVLLDGATATLDLGGNAIGTATNGITFDVRQGTIMNLAEFNGGGDLVKTTAGTLTFDGTSTYTGNTLVQEGLVIAVGGGNNRLGTTGGLTLGSGTNSAMLRLGTAAGASDQTFGSLATSGTGTSNAIVGGNAAFSTLTINQAGNTTFGGAIGGANANENNLNLVKSGLGELVIAGPRTYTGTTTVSGGKLYIDTAANVLNTTVSLTVGDGAEFAMRGSSNAANVVYDFSWTGNVITVGSSTGGTLGFALDGGFNTQLKLAAGQTMTVNGTLTTAVYVNSAPNAGQQYVLIDGADPNSLHAGSGTFSPNPVVFNGGSFTYALTNVTLGGTVDRWVLTPTAQAAAANVWWKGDLDGIGTGVWSASTTTGTGFPTNWDDGQATNQDALVPPDEGSIVHFSATGAANFATTLGANLTIQELIFHSGATPISIGSSGGTNTLTIGNATDAAGMTMEAGAPNVSFSANITLAKDQAFVITDAAATFTMSGNLGGNAVLTINNNSGAVGSLILTGPLGVATHTGGTNLLAGKLIVEGGLDNRLPSVGAFTMGDSTVGGILQLGDAVNGPSNTTIGSLSSVAATTNAIVGGNAAISTLTVVQATSGTYRGVLGGAGVGNNLALTKQGSQTLTLDGANTYAGITTVNSGTLQLGAAGSIAGSASLFVNAAAGTTAVFDVNGRTATFVGGITLGGAANDSTSSIIDGGTGGSVVVGGDVVFDGTNDPLGATISADIDLGNVGRSIFANDSATAAVDLTIDGDLLMTAGTNGTGLVLNGTGTGVLNSALTLALGGNHGTADLTKNGTGTWSIRNVVTVGDDFLINSGTFNVDTGGQLTWNSTSSTSPDLIIDTTAAPIVNFNVADSVVGNAGTNRIFLRDGSTLNINAANAIGASIESVTLGDNSQGIGNLVLNADAAVPTVNLGFDSSGEIGNITGAGTLTVTTLNLNNGLISANLSNGTAGNITKDSLTVTLSGDNSLGAGTTLIREGTLILDFTNNNSADSKIGLGNLTMGATTAADNRAILQLSGNGGGASLQTVASVIVAGGPSEINFVAAGFDTVLRTAAISRTGGTLNLSLPDVNSKFEITGGAANVNGIVGGWLTVNDSSFATIFENGANDLLQALPSTVTNDVSQWQANSNVTNDAAFTGVVGDCNTINSLRFNFAGAATVTVGERLIVSSGGIMVTADVGANASTITGGELLTAAGDWFFHQHNTTGLLTIASNLLNGNITKNGAGTLLLSGANTTGTVDVDEGVLQLSGGQALSDTSRVTIRNVAGARLEIVAGAANSETIGSLVGDGSQASLLIGAGAVLTINQTATGTFGGVISSSGSLVKNGASTLTLTGNSSSTGTLTINQGRIALSGASGAINTMTSITVNGGELLIVQDQSSSVGRIGNAVGVTLNNTAGGAGLWLQRTANDSTGAENIGPLVIGAGHNVITAEGATGTGTGNATLADLVADAFTRTGRATALVRGVNLGSTATGARRGFIRFDAGGQAALNGAEVGLSGGTGINTPIIPWLVGEITNTGLGNSFVTNIDGTTGLRPLATTEYIDAAGFNLLTGGAASTNNVRISASANLTGTPTAINSLVLDATTAIVLNGTANPLEITSGAILAANTGSHSLGTFTALTTGGGRDYTVYVTNSATQTLTVNSPLTSTVPLVKSGAGVLSLTSASNAFTDVFFNQGFVLADGLNKLGSGTFNFFGGGVRLAAGFADDLSSKTWNINTGGGVIDVSLVTAGTAFANGIDDTTANVADTLNIVSRSSTTGSVGLLTIQGSSSYIGTTIFNHAVNSSTITSVLLNGNTNAAINGNIQIGNVTSGTLDVIVGLAADEQIVDTASITFVSASGAEAYFKLFGRTETVAGIAAASRGVIENHESATDSVPGNGKLIVNSGENFSFTGFMRDRASGTGGTLAFEKQGTGTQTLVGANIIYTGITTISGGTLQLTDATAFNSAVVNNATLLVNRTTGTQTISVPISGTGTLYKIGAGTLILSGPNSYSGLTRIDQGVLSIAASNHLGDGSATNTIRIANGGTLRVTASTDLGANRDVHLSGIGATIEVTDSNIAEISGTVTGLDCQLLTKSGTGTLILSADNSYAGNTSILAGILQVGDGGTSGTLGAGSVTNDGTLRFDRTDGLTIGIAIGGTGQLVQAGAGRILLAGINTYAGPTTISAGILQFNKPTAFYNAVQTNWTATNLVVQSGATAAFTVGGAEGFTESQIAAISALGTGVGGFLSGSSLGFDTTNAGGEFIYSTTIDNPNGGTNSIGVVKYGSGALVLSAANGYSGVTSITEGTVRVATSNNLGNGGATNSISIINDATLEATGTFDLGVNRSIAVGSGGATISVTGSNKLTVSGVISGAGLNKVGTGTLLVTGNSGGYNGGVNVGAGVMTVNGSLGSAINVAANAVLNGGVSGTPATIGGHVVVATNGEFGAGSSADGVNGHGVGQLNLSGNLTWNGGSSLVFDFAGHDGLQSGAGTDWDFLDVAGTLTITNSPSKITLFIDSWSDLNTYGNAPDFDANSPEAYYPNPSYSWLWVETGGLTDGSNSLSDVADLSNYFDVNANRNGTGALFHDGNTTGGNFWVSSIGNNLYINYSSVPEPGSMVLIGVAALGFAGYRRRKRKANEQAVAEQNAIGSESNADLS